MAIITTKAIGQFSYQIEGQAEDLGLSMDPLYKALVESTPISPDMYSTPRAIIGQLRESLAALEQQCHFQLSSALMRLSSALASIR